MKIGEQLKKLRKRAGLTQIQLSERLQVVQSLISSVENGKGATTTEMVERWVNVCKGRIVIFSADPPEEVPPQLRQLCDAAMLLSEDDISRLTLLAQTLSRVDVLTADLLRSQIDGPLSLLRKSDSSDRGSRAA